MTADRPDSTPTPPRTVGIMAKTRLPEAASVVAEVADWLDTRGVAVVVEVA